MIEVIFFDLGNVIVNFDYHIISQKLKNFTDLSESQIYYSFDEPELKKSFDEGKLSAEQFYERVSARLGLRLPFDKFKRIWEDIFWLNESVADLIPRLKKKYRMFLVSNTDEIHFAYIRRKFEVLNYMDDFIVSYEVGSRKPHEAIFREALWRAATLPERCLFIDDIKEHVASAQELGLRGIVYRTTPQLIEEFNSLGISVVA